MKHLIVILLFNATLFGQWTIKPANVSNELVSMEFVNQSTGWIAGSQGIILKTTNGGTFVNVEPISNIIPQSFELKQNYPNPFNSQTKIKFEISAKDNYFLKIYI